MSSRRSEVRNALLRADRFYESDQFAAAVRWYRVAILAGDNQTRTFAKFEAAQRRESLELRKNAARKARKSESKAERLMELARAYLAQGDRDIAHNILTDAIELATGFHIKLQLHLERYQTALQRRDYITATFDFVISMRLLAIGKIAPGPVLLPLAATTDPRLTVFLRLLAKRLAPKSNARRFVGAKIKELEILQRAKSKPLTSHAPVLVDPPRMTRRRMVPTPAPSRD